MTKRFGALLAIDALNLTFKPGVITSVIGPNGAGKSTLINMCAGSYKVSSGRILLDDVELQSLKKHRIAQRGVARTYQNIRLFDGMTVCRTSRSACFPSFRPDLREVFVPGAFAADEGGAARPLPGGSSTGLGSRASRTSSPPTSPTATRSSWRSRAPPCSAPRC